MAEGIEVPDGGNELVQVSPLTKILLLSWGLHTLFLTSNDPNHLSETSPPRVTKVNLGIVYNTQTLVFCFVLLLLLFVVFVLLFSESCFLCVALAVLEITV